MWNYEILISEHNKTTWMELQRIKNQDKIKPSS